MSPDDERHGSEAGHEQHKRDDEDPCAACAEAKIIAGRRRSKRKAMGHHYTVPADAARDRLTAWREAGATYGEMADHTGVEEGRLWEILNDGAPVVYTRTAARVMRVNGWPVTAASITRRVRALCRLGWTIPAIADACGVHHDTILDVRRRQPEFVSRKVRTGIVAGYEALSMRLPEPKTQQEKAGVTRARNHAERMGWPAPMVFDDIDDPDERPDLTATDDQPDPVVVERILAGDYRLHATPAERTDVCRQWVARGRSLAELERLTGWRPDRYFKVSEEAA